MFDNYLKYLNFLTNKSAGFFEAQKPYIKCCRGCAKCCKNAEFPYSEIELKYLLSGFLELDEVLRNKIEQSILKTVEEKKKFTGDKFLYDCPFLIDDACSVYEYRGIVCRTFGLIEATDNDDDSKIPFCAFSGLNYASVLDEKNRKISREKFQSLNIEQMPLAYNIGYKFLTDEKIERIYNFKFGEKKPLIEWFVE